MLPEVVEAVGGRAKIMVDGSFCRGTDIVKAIAAGADLVGIGRMQCYALGGRGPGRRRAHAGTAGGRGQRCLGLLGVYTSPSSTAYLQPAPPANAPHVLSAFPLLEIEAVSLLRAS